MTIQKKISHMKQLGALYYLPYCAHEWAHAQLLMFSYPLTAAKKFNVSLEHQQPGISCKE